MILNHFNRFREIGILVMRIGMGIAFVIHGLPKIVGGVPVWEELGRAMGFIGITSFPAFWGFMAGLAEFGGGILLILGVLFRPACMALAFTMLTAMMYHIGKGQGFSDFSHAMEDGIIFLALLLIGPGKYSLDEKFDAKR
ncbi:MAG: DoxX family protein [Leptospiraceae bacterium]|nr:DoxX family protein [Leptospiraceae bacterium]MCZ8347012.1 DoxX family protein [Leptospiraceae bacterium]PJE01015.1 MAG: DoxX family protein [Leptospira sp.]